MKPKTFLRADIADLTPTQLDPSHRRPLSPSYADPVAKLLVSDCQAIDVVPPEEFAGGFGLFALKPGKTGPIEGSFTLLYRFGEGACGGQEARRLALGQGQALLGLRLVRIGADLDDPAGAGLRPRRRHHSGGRGRGRGYLALR